MLMELIPIEPIPIPYPCSRCHEPDAYGTDTDAVCGILFWWYSMPMAMMLMPFPCPVVTVTDAHGTDTHIHAVDTDTMCGILDTHAANTMNQMPMELIPIEPMPMPCVASSGGDRHLCS